MHDRKDFDRVLAQPVGDDERRAGDHQLSGSRKASFAPTPGERLQLVDRAQNEDALLSRGAWLVLGDVGLQRFEIADRPPRPVQSHFGGEISWLEPQDWSHWTTS